LAALMLPASIAETVELVRGREASAVELAERSLAAIEAREPELNAFATVMRESAFRDARRVDAGLDDAGPLAGAPFAVKDAFFTVGAPTRGGSSHWCSPPAAEDAPVVAALRRAGAVLVGKTTMNEFGWGLDPEVGSVANPVLHGRSAGGSSGGSAAAVAARSVAFALGTDGGGSIRMPASFCGLVGLKPSRDLLPRAGMIPGGRTLTEPGPLCTCVADTRAVLRVLAGGAAEVAPTLRPVLRLVDGSLVSCKPLVQGALVRAVGALAPDETVTLELEGAAESWYAIFAAEAAVALRGVLSRMSPDLRRLVDEGAEVGATDYLAALAYANELGRRLDEALAGSDALLAPTVPSTAPADEPEWNDDDFFGDMFWTVPANLTGHPAVTLPIPGAPEPVGLQLIGKRGGDEALLAIAAYVEEQLNAAGSENVHGS